MEAIHELTVKLYETALTPAYWSEYLDILRRKVDARCLAVFFQDARVEALEVEAVSGMSEDWLVKFREYYGVLNPFYRHSLRCGTRDLGRFMFGDEMVPRDELTRTEYFNEFMEPAGWCHSDGGVFFAEGSARGLITTGRSAEQGPCTPRGMALFQSLMPHLSKAFGIRRKIFEVESRVAALSDAIDQLAAGVVLLDDRGVVIHTNVASRLIIDQRDGLELTRDQKISSGRSDVRASIDRLVGSALLTSQGKGVSHGGNLAVPRPSGKRPYQLVVTPLAFEGAENVSRRPFVAVFVTDPEREPRLPEESLVDQYGLTPAESGIAVRLATGRELSDIADELQITMNTARTHVKRILLKTDTRRQTQLISLLLRGAIELRH